MLALALTFAFATAPQAATPLDVQRLDVPATMLKLDGRWYPLPAGTLSLKSNGDWHASQALPMQDCTRPGGESQEITSSAWRWTSGLRTIYLDPDPDRGFALEWFDGAWVVALRSATGDVACAGTASVPGAFGDGFE
jgi:hypothetical protein